eukprot:TRINITY_DN17407_c0_g1_i1.p1 TRINITY_DN17407_c0_g1~~TRINITY_DN17407_c0_g1_i1.p1  ORF type:complete len:539 (-),score=151.11 TRINITY_DN17407_c0_g1_i1:101-1717(-)
MATLTSLLPQPKNTYFPPAHNPPPPPEPQHPKFSPPPYGQRHGFIPRSVDDFGDGGAFPEIHVAQHPLEMGKNKIPAGSSIVPLTLDSEGRIKYDAIVTRETKNRVFSRYADSVESVDEELARPTTEEEEETTAKTRAALETIVHGKIKAARPAAPVEKQNAPSYIRYTPSQQGEAFNSGANARVIRMVEMPKDPLEPPKFKHKKVPRGPPSPPVPILHSPPRKVTSQEQQDWKIPPCISNWKNPKGYTIPLDKRLAADGRGLQQVQINDNFAKLSEALYIAERKAREEVEIRASILEKMARKEKEKREKLLRKLAAETREKRAGFAAMHAGADLLETEEERKEREERDTIREDRKRDRERDRRMEVLGHKKSKLSRDSDRDVSEKIALGEQAATSSNEVQYDSRLFSQSQGMDSGFAHDDTYNVYDKPLFKGTSASMLYRPKKNEDSDMYGDPSSMEKILNTSRFKPDKDFDGVDRSKPDTRQTPVEFEKHNNNKREEEDPFGLDEFLKEAKTGGKKLDKIGKTGHMHAGSTGGGRR